MVRCSQLEELSRRNPLIDKLLAVPLPSEIATELCPGGQVRAAPKADQCRYARRRLTISRENGVFFDAAGPA